MNPIVLGIVKVFIITLISLSFRILLQVFGQRWIKTSSHTSTIVILPILTFVITTVIAGNIALSLGMVGALSIVRFRNPVRSPLELTVYFTAITLGITAYTNMKWLIFLAFSIYFAVFLLLMISLISKRLFNYNFFITSFSEGNSLSTLEVNSKVNLEFLENNKYLKSKSSSAEIKSYLLASDNFDVLKSILKVLDEEKSVIDYRLNE